MSDRDWKPVRDGEIYCSPACGFKCTHARYKRAKENARALADLLGEGWKPRVWENGDWFYEVTKGDLQLTIHEYDGKFWFQAWHQTSPQTSGKPRRTPAGALESLYNILNKNKHEIIKAQMKLVDAKLSIEKKVTP